MANHISLERNPGLFSFFKLTVETDFFLKNLPEVGQIR